MSASIPAAVLGATGYVGGELLRLLGGHPSLTLCAAVSDSRGGTRIADTFPHLAASYGDTTFATRAGWIDAFDSGSDLALFSAAPHGASAALIEAALDAAARKNLDVHVVDVSADFRYADAAAYEAVYGPHGAPALLDDFHCALPEHCDAIDAPHIGHPGCFATAVLLAIVPLYRAGLVDGEVFVSGITGSTGSGREPQAGTHHPERHGNLYAYKPLVHRHAPEVVALTERASGTAPRLRFVPHSGPFARGIYVTVQAASEATSAQLTAAFDDAYRDAPFIDLVDGAPRLKSVVASNRCQIGFAADGEALVVMSAIDNLVKGAAGGAVQWMNRLFDLPQTTGLDMPAPGWT